MSTDSASRTTTGRQASDFTRLSRRMAAAGLLGTRPGYYALRVCLVTALLAGGWVAFALLGDSWWQLPVAAFLAVMFGQVALVAHDLAHRQVFRRRRPSETAGLIAGNLSIGLSYGWWQPTTEPPMLQSRHAYTSAASGADLIRQARVNQHRTAARTAHRTCYRAGC